MENVTVDLPMNFGPLNRIWMMLSEGQKIGKFSVLGADPQTGSGNRDQGGDSYCRGQCLTFGEKTAPIG